MNIEYLIRTGALFPIFLALVFVFSNGFRDSSTIVATVVSTRVLSPTFAFFVCGLFEFFGAFFISSAVSSTVRGSLVGEAFQKTGADLVTVVESGLLSAIFWGVLSWWRAWPTSNNQALIAGLFGSSVAAWGLEQFRNKTILLIFGILISSPLIGFVISTLFNMVLRKMGGWFTPKIKPIADGLHVLACLLVSCAHGSNDTQLLLGVMSALFMTLHYFALAVPSEFTRISVFFHFVVALSLSMGVLFGGRRILKKMGMKFFLIRDTEGLGAEISSAATIMVCNMTGFPASTTQVISGAIVGAGVAKNARAVRWQNVQDISLSWLVTLPSVATIGYVFFKVIA